MDRRQLLKRATGMGMAMALGPSFWQRALAAPVQPGESPYGDLLPPDVHGLQLPEGFTSRVVAVSLAPVEGTTHVWHPFPDGGACVPADDGGWVYVSNSENPPPADIPIATSLAELIGPGGVGAIRFDAEGTIVDAYPILTGSLSNCAGGITPWGTWLSCEEWEEDEPYDAGKVWECDPFGGPPVLRLSLGVFKHEAATVDPDRRHVYLSEDQRDGLLYRYTPPDGAWGSGDALEGGTLHAMAVDGDGPVSWLPVADAAAPSAPLRSSVAGATPFDGGEGIVYDDGHVYLTTKGDDRVWDHDIEAGTMRVLYDAADLADPVLDGVDNIIVSRAHDLYVAEDGGNLEVCVITPELAVFPVVRLTGPQHGQPNATPIPTISEVTGLALSPDGNRLYLASERGQGTLPIGPGPGILYEVTGPFRGGSLAASAAAAPLPTPAPAEEALSAPEARAQLPATGGADRAAAALALGAAGAAAMTLRRRVQDPSG
jgi:hypothetical protein